MSLLGEITEREGDCPAGEPSQLEPRFSALPLGQFNSIYQAFPGNKGREDPASGGQEAPTHWASCREQQPHPAGCPARSHPSPVSPRHSVLPAPSTVSVKCSSLQLHATLVQDLFAICPNASKNFLQLSLSSHRPLPGRPHTAAQLAPKHKCNHIILPSNVF